MSGRDERPNYRLYCPECECMGEETKRWTLIVGDRGIDDGSFGWHFISGELYNELYNVCNFIGRCEGQEITMIRCDCTLVEYNERHVYTKDDTIFKNVMKAAKFKDGIVRERGR